MERCTFCGNVLWVEGDFPHTHIQDLRIDVFTDEFAEIIAIFAEVIRPKC